MTTPPLADAPIRSALALTRRWVTLLDPPVFGARSLWLTWLDRGGRQLPLVVPVDDLPALPDRRAVSGLRQLHDTVAELHLEAGGHLAMALCRPGECVITADDDEWLETLREEFDEGRADRTWSLHLAAGGRVVPLVERPVWAW